jgi:hypothetical protein
MNFILLILLILFFLYLIVRNYIGFREGFDKCTNCNTIGQNLGEEYKDDPAGFCRSRVDAGQCRDAGGTWQPTPVPPPSPTEVLSPPAEPEKVLSPPAEPEKVLSPPAEPEEVLSPPAEPEEVLSPPAEPEEVLSPPAEEEKGENIVAKHKNRPQLNKKKKDIKPELMKKIKELEENISKLQFQTKKTKLRGQNLVAVDKLDMGKLSMDLFNWQKINKRSPVDINLILGDHIKNAAKETTIKHVIPSKENSPEVSEKPKHVEYKGFPVFKKPEFPQVSSEKYALPKGAKAGAAVKMNSSISNINDNVPKSYNSWDYDQKPDTGIEKTH